MIAADRWNLQGAQEIRVEFGPEDAVEAAERLIRPSGDDLPMVEDAPPVTPWRHRTVAIALLLVFVLPFLATIVRTIER
jgi:hypothetical protein